jgi:Concanavalin A-like lectin/glucanases superfamily
MASLFPLQGNCVRIVAKAAAFGFVLANAWIETLDAQPISPPPGLVSWWPGDRNAKDIIDDNDGLLKGGASFGRGLVRQAFRLDGVNDCVLVPDRSNLRFGTSDFTVDLWVNFRTTEGEQILIENYVQTFGEGPLQGWSLTKLEGDIIRLQPPIDPVDEPPLDVQPPPILPDTWYFVAMKRSGDDFTIYWNAVPLGSASFSVNLDTCAALKFGHRCNAEDTPSCAPGFPACSDDRGFFLNGLIDEVEIYNRALSEDEILAIFEAGRFGKIKPRRQ